MNMTDILNEKYSFKETLEKLQRDFPNNIIKEKHNKIEVFDKDNKPLLSVPFNDKVSYTSLFVSIKAGIRDCEYINKLNNVDKECEIFDNIKDKVYPKLVPSDNISYLKDKISSNILDLKKTYVINMTVDKDKIIVPVTKSLFNRWHISEETLDKQAMENLIASSYSIIKNGGVILSTVYGDNGVASMLSLDAVDNARLKLQQYIGKPLDKVCLFPLNRDEVAVLPYPLLPEDENAITIQDNLIEQYRQLSKCHYDEIKRKIPEMAFNKEVYIYDSKTNILDIAYTSKELEQQKEDKLSEYDDD